MKTRIAASVIALVVLSSTLWGVTHVTEIRDWFALRQYAPSEDIVSLADRSGMSDEGRRLFYVSSPELDDASVFNTNCPVGEETIVLGCYTNLRIYIYDVTDERLTGVEEVTSAHEMLHAAYARLSTKDKNRVNHLLDEQLKHVEDERILQLIDEYRKSSPQSLYNEIHSILGTEYGELSAELEEYYRRYFRDRQSVVALSDQYESQFVERAEQIESYDKEIDDLRSQIETTETAITPQKQTLDGKAEELNRLKTAGDIDGYNSGVGAYNELVYSYNNLIDEYRYLVDLHNQKVDERNKIAFEQRELLQSLDSTYAPAAP